MGCLPPESLKMVTWLFAKLSLAKLGHVQEQTLQILHAPPPTVQVLTHTLQVAHAVRAAPQRVRPTAAAAAAARHRRCAQGGAMVQHSLLITRQVILHDKQTSGKQYSKLVDKVFSTIFASPGPKMLLLHFKRYSPWPIMSLTLHAKYTP